MKFPFGKLKPEIIASGLFLCGIVPALLLFLRIIISRGGSSISQGQADCLSMIGQIDQFIFPVCFIIALWLICEVIYKIVLVCQLLIDKMYKN